MFHEFKHTIWWAGTIEVRISPRPRILNYYVDIFISFIGQSIPFNVMRVYSTLQTEVTLIIFNCAFITGYIARCYARADIKSHFGRVPHPAELINIILVVRVNANACKHMKDLYINLYIIYMYVYTNNALFNETYPTQHQFFFYISSMFIINFIINVQLLIPFMHAENQLSAEFKCGLNVLLMV